MRIKKICDKNKGILYVGHTGTSGYAIAAKGYMFDMICSGYPVFWSPIEHGEGDECDFYQHVVNSVRNKEIETEIMIIHDPPCGWEHHYHERVHSGIDHVIGYTVWETESLPDEWVKIINGGVVDEVWVPTKYNKRVFEESGVVIPVRVVPHVWMGNPPPKKQDDDRFIFYNISEFTERKGITDLVEIYCQECSKKIWKDSNFYA